MCNIAGYVGSQQAAPILLDMIQAEEGCAGGYYTGIATIHEGRLHYAKVVGDTARLRAETDAEALPGAIGIAHTRSNSGGDREWSHPFIACHDGLAYIANGSAGKWTDDPRRIEGAQRLADAGHVYHATHQGKIGTYPMLRDGRCVHMSDVMAHGIEDALDRLDDPVAAVREAFLAMPSEIVGLFITPSHPQRIYGARWNLPCCVARDNSATYLASTPLAFPRGLTWWTWVPPFSCLSASADELALSPLMPPEEAPPDDINRAAARQVILDILADGAPHWHGEFCRAIGELSARPNLRVVNDPAYEIIVDLLSEGRVAQEVVRMPGAQDGIDAPRFLYRLVPTA